MNSQKPFWKRPNVWGGTVLLVAGLALPIVLSNLMSLESYRELVKGLTFGGVTIFTAMAFGGFLCVLGPKLKELGILKRFTGG